MENVAHSPAPTRPRAERVAGVLAHGFQQGTRAEQNSGNCETCQKEIRTTNSFWIDGGGETDDSWNGYCLDCAEKRVVKDQETWAAAGEMAREEFGGALPSFKKESLKPWNEYPVGSKAHAIGGGHWYRNGFGWKWNGPNGTGSTFPTPGANVFAVTAPGVELTGV